MDSLKLLLWVEKTVNLLLMATFKIYFFKKYVQETSYVIILLRVCKIYIYLKNIYSYSCTLQASRF